MNWNLVKDLSPDKFRWYIAGGDGSVVCKAPEKYCGASLKLWPERAYIIAAAPEAIAVLREVSAELDEIEICNPVYTKLLNKVNAVLLKSEGKGE
jgi:hypothetical protein